MTLNENWKNEGGEARTEDYRTWRTNMGTAGVCDTDQIEYRFVGDKLVPMAVIELCVADYGPKAEDPDEWERFKAKLEAKVSRDRCQGKLLRLLAKSLNTPLLLVCYVKGKLDDGVWVKQVGASKGWTQMSLADYKASLEGLKVSWYRYQKAKAA